jgi:hypothetical protein
MKSYFVFRTDDPTKEWIWQEIQKGRLRQGWGLSNMQLPVGREPKENEIQDWYRRYRNQGAREWGGKISEAEAVSRYNILRIMLDVVPGDSIVVPKMPEWGSFCILEASGKYRFDSASTGRGSGGDDFRHILPVKGDAGRIVGHRESNDAQMVAATLKGYQSALNRVRNDEIAQAIERLWKSKAIDSSKPMVDLLDDIANDEATKNLLDHVMNKVSKRSPNDFEKMIEVMLERGGYRIIERRKYDRRGGDVDLVAMPQLPPLAEVFDHRAPLLVQVKNKIGLDSNDTNAVDQLVQIAEQYPGASLVVISSASQFTDECIAKAKEHKVQLISREILARLLVRSLY